MEMNEPVDKIFIKRRTAFALVQAKKDFLKSRGHIVWH